VLFSVRNRENRNTEQSPAKHYFSDQGPEDWHFKLAKKSPDAKMVSTAQLGNPKSKIRDLISCVTILWVPGYVGIQGNKLTDSYAKEAITSPDLL